MNALGFAGLPATISGFKSKADALKFAIEFTASSDSSFQRTPSYQAAQELFDFICKNVNLPDVETNDISEAIKELARLKDADTHHCNCCHSSSNS